MFGGCLDDGTAAPWHRADEHGIWWRGSDRQRSRGRAESGRKSQKGAGLSAAVALRRLAHRVVAGRCYGELAKRRIARSEMEMEEERRESDERGRARKGRFSFPVVSSRS